MMALHNQPGFNKYFRVHHVATRLDCTKQWVYKLIQEGKLDAIRIGLRGIRVSKKSFDRFLSSQRIDPTDYDL